MLSCKQLVERSSDYLDARLSLRERLGVRVHLAMCHNCRRFIRQMRLAREVLRKLPDTAESGVDALAARLAAARRAQRATGRTDPPAPRE
jgi:predicted anti-sigma-YlaC factor YlaD